MRASAYRRALKRQSGIFAEPHAGIIPLKRRSASCWKACAARTVLMSCAARKGSIRTCTTVGRRSSWRRARNGSPATRRVEATSDEVKELKAEARQLKETLADGLSLSWFRTYLSPEAGWRHRAEIICASGRPSKIDPLRQTGPITAIHVKVWIVAKTSSPHRTR